MAMLRSWAGARGPSSGCGNRPILARSGQPVRASHCVDSMLYNVSGLLKEGECNGVMFDECDWLLGDTAIRNFQLPNRGPCSIRITSLFMEPRLTDDFPSFNPALQAPTLVIGNAAWAQPALGATPSGTGTPPLFPLPLQIAHFADASILYELPATDPVGDLIARTFQASVSGNAPQRAQLSVQDALSKASAQLVTNASQSPLELSKRAMWIAFDEKYYRTAAELAAGRVSSASSTATGPLGEAMSALSATELMETWWIRIVSLCRLGMHRLADAELERLGSFETDRFRVVLSPSEESELAGSQPPTGQLRIGRPDSSGSMSSVSGRVIQQQRRRTRNVVLFQLRLAAARLPAFLGDIDAALSNIARIEFDCSKELDYLRQRGIGGSSANGSAGTLPTSGHGNTTSEDLQSTWIHRILACRFQTCAILLMPSTSPSVVAAAGGIATGSDPINAVGVLASIVSSPLLKEVDTHSGEIEQMVSTALGRLLLQIGDVDSAARLFATIEQKHPGDTRTNTLHKALLAIGSGDPLQAIALLQPWAAAQQSGQAPVDPAIANALAIAYLYHPTAPSLGSAIATASVIPTRAMLSEPALLFNLATLNELADSGVERKQRILANVVASGATDDSALVGSFKLG